MADVANVYGREQSMDQNQFSGLDLALMRIGQLLGRPDLAGGFPRRDTYTQEVQQAPVGYQYGRLGAMLPEEQYLRTLDPAVSAGDSRWAARSAVLDALARAQFRESK